jgi:radical SAM protein with 4Fe4S-binding SPASM domain
MAHLTTILKPRHPVGQLEELCRRSKEACGIGEVLWLLTFRCNLRCKFCHTRSPREVQELTTKEAIEFIHHLGKLGVPIVFLSGGEPLLREDIEVVLKELNEVGVKVILSTNGTLVTPRVARLISDAKVLYVAAPLHGPKEVHDRLTQTRGAFDRVVEGMRVLADHGIPLCVKILVTEETYPHIPQLLDWSISQGIKAFYICDLVPAGRGGNVGRVGKEEWAAFLDKIVDYIEAEGIFVDIGAHPSTIPFVIEKIAAEDPRRASTIREGIRGRQCPVGEGFVSLMPDGGVSPCNFMCDLLFGNIRERPIEEIVDSFADFFDKVGEPCASCRWRGICGGCRAKAFYMLQDARKGDPTCLLQRVKWLSGQKG